MSWCFVFSLLLTTLLTLILLISPIVFLNPTYNLSRPSQLYWLIWWTFIFFQLPLIAFPVSYSYFLFLYFSWLWVLPTSATCCLSQMPACIPMPEWTPVIRAPTVSLYILVTLSPQPVICLPSLLLHGRALRSMATHIQHPKYGV